MFDVEMLLIGIRVKNPICFRIDSKRPEGIRVMGIETECLTYPQWSALVTKRADNNSISSDVVDWISMNVRDGFYALSYFNNTMCLWLRRD